MIFVNIFIHDFPAYFPRAAISGWSALSYVNAVVLDVVPHSRHKLADRAEHLVQRHSMHEFGRQDHIIEFPAGEVGVESVLPFYRLGYSVNILGPETHIPTIPGRVLRCILVCDGGLSGGSVVG